ncbi:phage tail tape measure protein [Blautia sp. AF32-4BH]|uniref:phage tail tape measure protein n=1 Tax=Blautia sp. AF32-4BH TaxID=2292967 RepID=UPI0018F5E7CF|nr:phage tail tape measure protein [Blautia sp. AF32-4BH]
MADDMKRVGLSFKTDGTVDFQKSLKQISEAVQGNREEFKRARIAWDDSTTAMEKLTDRQKYLQKQTETYNEKVEVLRRELSELEGAENKNEKAISQKKKQLSQAETTLAQYQKGLKEVNQEIKSGSAVLEENMKKLDDSISTLDASAKKNESSFKLMKSQWDKNTSSAKKLKDEQKYLTEQGETYQKKVGLVKEELKLLENAEGDNKKAIEEKKAALNEAEASLNEYKSRLKEVNEQLKFGKASIEEYTEKVQKAGEKVKDAGSGMTKKVTAPILAAGAASAKMAMDFEDSMAKVSTIADATEVPMDEMQKAILDLSNQTGISSEEIAQNVYDSISAGQKTGDAVNFVSNSTKLAKAGFADAGAALDVLTTIMNAYGLKASEVTNVSDMLIQTQNLGKTTVADLASSMGKVIPTANAYGVSLDELCAGYAIMTANGVATAESTTYMNGMLNELGKSGTTVSETLKEKTGKTFKELMDSGMSLSDVLKIISDAATENNKSFGDMWSSSEAGKAGMILLGDSAENFNGVLEQMQNSAGATNTAFEKLDTNSTKIKKATNELKNDAIDLGTTLMEELAPIIENIAEKISQFTEWFNGLSESEKQMIIQIGLIVAAIGPLLIVLGTVVSSGAKIIGGIPVIAKGLSGLFGIIAANPVLAIITAIVIAVFTLWTTCDEFREGVLEGIDILKTVLTAGYDFCVELGEEKLGRIQDAYEKHGGGITGILAASWQTWKEIWSTGFDVIDKLTGGKLTGVKNKFWSKFEEIKNVVKNALDAVKRFFAGEWPTPKIKMPHFRISPPGWSIGDLVKGSIPRLSVNWHAKGAILNRPTVINQSGNTIDVAGEAGPEAVTPIETLRKYVREEVKENNADLIKALAEVLGNLGLTMENVINLGDERIYQKVVKLTIKELNRQQTSKPVWKGGFA